MSQDVNFKSQQKLKSKALVVLCMSTKYTGYFPYRCNMLIFQYQQFLTLTLG